MSNDFIRGFVGIQQQEISPGVVKRWVDVRIHLPDAEKITPSKDLFLSPQDRQRIKERGIELLTDFVQG